MTALRAAFLLWVVAAAPAAASSFNIAPIRVDLSAGRRTEVLTLTNADDQPVVVQVRVLAWSQQNGEEQLDDTRDVLVTPPVLQIPGNKEQILRVALRRDQDPGRELTYRIIFEEVPQAAPVNFTGLRVALRLSVPIFVAPTRAKAAAAVTWQTRSLADGQIEVAATNSGTGHLQVTDFDVQMPGATHPLRGMISKYVLSGSRMLWTLKPETDGAANPAMLQGPSRAAPESNPPVVIHGHSDQGEFSADAALSGL